MQDRQHNAEIFRDGERIAEAAVIISRFQPRAAVVPLPGQHAVGYKDLSTQGPTTIKIEEPDPGFRVELERLQAAGRDIEIARRDRGWRPQPVSVKVSESVYEECVLDRPLNPYGPLDTTEFELHHRDF